MAFFKKITLRSHLSIDTLKSILSAELESKKYLRFEKTTHEYEWEIENNTFKINRIINYRNSFLPVIKGEFVPWEHGTEINLIIKLHLIVIIFLMIWFSFAGIMTLILLLGMFSDGFNITILIPVGMILAVYLLVTKAYGYESNKAKKGLMNIFQAEIMQ